VAGRGRAGGFSPDGYGRDAGIGQRVAIEPTLDDHGALACGDGSSVRRKVLGFSSPRTSRPPTFTSNGTRGGSRWHGNTEEPRGFAESFNGFIVKAVTPRGAKTLTERQDRRQAHIYPRRPDT
jgi:hypothetical protein